MTDREQTLTSGDETPREAREHSVRLDPEVGELEAAREHDALRLKHEALRRKYRSLCAKYEELVERWRAATSHRSGPAVLAIKALRESSLALALLEGDVIAGRNPTWRALDQPGPEWRLIPEGDLARERSYPALHALALGEAGALVRSGEPFREERFEREDGVAIDVRLEWAITGRRPPVVLVVIRDATERVARERARASAWQALFRRAAARRGETLEDEDGPFAAIEPAPV